MAAKATTCFRKQKSKTISTGNTTLNSNKRFYLFYMLLVMCFFFMMFLKFNLGGCMFPTECILLMEICCVINVHRIKGKLEKG